MVNILRNIGDAVDKVTGGYINRTLARLTGAGISTDSRIVQAQAAWTGRDSRKDWRVRLTVPEGSPLEDAFFFGNPVLAPLNDIKGMFWPLTPSMVIQHSANYNALSQTHSNYPFQAYQNSQVDQINIIGEFPVQNSDDAKHWVATIKFLRTITKMFFGGDSMKGNPPPILHLSGYGEHMFEKVPVIVNTFNVELRSGIDYISTVQNTTNYQTARTRQRMGLPELESSQTWAPTLSNISVLVTPVYSRETIKNFSLQKFARGQLSKEQGIGFI
tara:strand:- start:224 stop:1042 length:819 start_codon:yes stop_codon:yes gene_type:complete